MLGEMVFIFWKGVNKKQIMKCVMQKLSLYWLLFYKCSSYNYLSKCYSDHYIIQCSN